MRIKVRLGKDTVEALSDAKNIFWQDRELRVSTGFIFKRAWSEISEIVDQINWAEVSKYKPTCQDPELSGVHTTINFDSALLDEIHVFQFDLSKEFQQLVYFTGALKLLIFACIMKRTNILPQKEGEK